MLIPALSLRFHHFGLASSRPERSLKFLDVLGYLPTRQVYDPIQNVNLSLCMHSTMPTVELVAPGEGEGPLDAILATANGSIYHLCYETEDLEESLRALKLGGFRVVCISSPKPAVLFDNRRVSFYMIKDFGIVELLECN
jgi:methylmalonyl-CoA/ethylmalonyl-CoA epimerase